ncbi:MAG: succinate dehydrogenase cytochrome b subunit [Planctomycetota bacterium]|nr:succinate dehydrogenase cytochrome b subunit [Planctomycetota bacterium]MDA1212288.1 succinate dehydrogenase cytochrome b subunit [Planctomycetota bacterium]
MGKKFVMAITGLLLCGFLVVHLAGNFLLYVSPEAYNEYAHKLHSQEQLLMVAEVGLFALFIFHIYLAFSLTRDNQQARNVSYARRETKIEVPGPTRRISNWMMATGFVVLGFLILHLADFKFEARSFDYEGKEPFDKAVMILKNPVTMGLYLAGSIALWVHLTHGFSSAFQSLGLLHPKIKCTIEWIGIIFAGAIGIGFGSFVVWAMIQ